jgi:hypothetical protein
VARDGDGGSSRVGAVSNGVDSCVSQVRALGLSHAANELVRHSTDALPSDVTFDAQLVPVALPLERELLASQPLAACEGDGIYCTLSELACSPSGATRRSYSSSTSADKLASRACCERDSSAGTEPERRADDAEDEDDIAPYAGMRVVLAEAMPKET